MSNPVSTTADLEPACIEQELRGLWAKLAAEKNTTIPLIKKNAVNLIAIVADSKGAAAANTAVAALSGRHPGRFITIVLHPDKGVCHNKENVSPQCALTLACSADTCYEHIVIPDIPGQNTNLPQLAKPLLHDELPVILWWRYPFHPEEPLFQAFSAIADQVILDSVTMQNPQNGFTKILELLRSRKNAGVQDINWTRLTPWRVALAGLYDLAAYRPFLDKITHIEIKYSHQLSRHQLINNSQVLLLFGWLASRLGWCLSSGITEEQSGQLYRISAVSGSNQPIICRFRVFAAASHQEAGLKQICLTAWGTQQANFSITLCQDNQHLQTRISLPENSPPEKITRLEVGSEIDLVTNGMTSGTPDSVYQQTLEYLGGNTILWKFGEDRDTVS
ncbi:glucose-6-phosphate dehydrogenase assembly protein OpcA [Sporomusa sp.]|uniref:glucose-6-phosphate dehydrogenase assembly protein OpcA n=1 Tax=Sporomusa sp. TaxID=2078658 RepID=UPI002B8DBC87|nr:glucose-6-phosphate dehydrogenase assembly protein OpcA [Sporomusa sp.]HWR07254.1 glucose-6-phosphate dehydrogenase assembly protein OpcA [Sporomusa sp.]